MFTNLRRSFWNWLAVADPVAPKAFLANVDSRSTASKWINDDVERLATMGQGRPETDIASIEAMSQPKAAEMLNVGRATVQRAREVLDSGTPDLVKAVERGEMKVSSAAIVAKQPPSVSSGWQRWAKAGPKQHSPIGETSQAKAAGMLSVGKRTVQRAREVLDSGTPELVKAVERGEMKVSTAAIVSKQPVSEQTRPPLSCSR